MIEETKTILSTLAGTEAFDGLAEADKDKEITTAQRVLKMNYGAWRITPEVVAFQLLYTLEAKSEHIHHLEKHNVTNYSVKGASVSFGEKMSPISPEVISVLGAPSNGSKVGRFY